MTDPTSVASQFSVRAGERADARSSAGLHAAEISEGFLSYLGSTFLVRLYRRIVLSPGAFLLMAESDGCTVGFIAGSTDVAALYRSFILRDGVPAALPVAPRLVGAWPKVMETLKHGRPRDSRSPRGAELLAVAVDPSWRGQGVGALLVAAFLEEVVRREVEAAHVVVACGNRSAVALYRRAGFVVGEAFELHAGTSSQIMRWSASGGPPRPADGAG